MKEIRTERLLIRLFSESDYDDLYEFLSQLKDDEFEGYPGITYENGRQYLQQRLNSEEFFAVVLPLSGKVIGNIYCGKRDYDTKEVGYIINRNYRRTGYAGEALSAVIENTFREGTHRVFAKCDPRNTASWRLLEKAGFTREAYFRQNIWFQKDPNGAPVWKDTYVYAKLSTDKRGGISVAFDIRKLTESEIPAALDLAWKTFSEFESPDYAPEGTEEFRKCIHDAAYLSGIEYYGAFDGENLIGEIGIRPDKKHICFFFVDGRYHRRGIGTALFRYLRQIFPHETLTLNSSPYGLPFYQAIGFVPTEEEKTVNGIRFTPMKYTEEESEKDSIPIIRTERLLLREMDMHDYDALYRVLADSDIMKHYPYAFDEKRVRGWIERNINRYRADGFGLWAVCLKDTGEMIGDCGLTLQNINGEMLPEIGYHIRRDCQRKGYAKEAAAAVRDWAFQHTDYPALYSYCKHTNKPSIRTAESIGMHFDCEYPDPANGTTHVSVVRRDELIQSS